jgi:hypothetical protein
MTSVGLDTGALNCLGRSVLCWLATADAEGRPNVSPKEVFCAVSPSEIRIANIASPRSRANITANPNVCLSAVDVFELRGFKITAHAHVVSASAPEFERLVKPLAEMAGPGFPIRDVFVLKPLRVSPIIAPSWRLFPDRTPAERRDATLAAYGVRDDDRSLRNIRAKPQHERHSDDP